MSAVFAPDRVDQKNYYGDGKRYDRVTTVLDKLAGLGTPGAAAAMITAKEVQTAASDLCSGVVPRATNITSLEGFTEFLAGDDGRDWLKGRYFAGLGDYADTGTLVDLGFQQILEGGWFDEESAIDWVSSEVQAINASREFTKTEYEQAIKAQNAVVIEELKAKPRFPAHVDILGAARRIVCLTHWWEQSGLTHVKSQETLRDDSEKVAGTFDLLAKDDEALYMIDLKTGSYTSAVHAAQVAKYAEMLGILDTCTLRLIYARYSEGEAKVYDYTIKDKDAALWLWKAALRLHRTTTSGLFNRAKTFSLKAS